MNQLEMLPGLHRVFCWTRFGTEAGETIDEILDRKENERLANHGIFFWGVGTSIAPGLRLLLSNERSPHVLFSPMRSRPRAVDVRPTAITEWHAGKTLDGQRFVLPPSARITSRRSTANRQHYALVCRSDTPLRIDHLGVVNAGQLVNWPSGNRIGASQVTAVVEERPSKACGPIYEVALRARLEPPYFVYLRDADLAGAQRAA